MKAALGLTLRRAMARLVSATVREFMPYFCVFCGVICKAEERAVCEGCREDLPWIHCACPACGIPLPPPAGICGACQLTPPPFERCIAALEYEFPIDAAIRALKFHRRLSCVPAFGNLLLSAATTLPYDVDALLPVPLHRWRYAKRGFNQAALIAKFVSRELQLPIINNVHRVVATPYQSGLNARERRKNLVSAFDVHGAILATHVVIVDDVITTGETCRELATTMLASGVEKVSVLALARA